jgi:hypothetical protein
MEDEDLVKMNLDEAICDYESDNNSETSLDF